MRGLAARSGPNRSARTARARHSQGRLGGGQAPAGAARALACGLPRALSSLLFSPTPFFRPSSLALLIWWQVVTRALSSLLFSPSLTLLPLPSLALKFFRSYTSTAPRVGAGRRTRFVIDDAAPPGEQKKENMPKPHEDTGEAQPPIKGGRLVIDDAALPGVGSEGLLQFSKVSLNIPTLFDVASIARNIKKKHTVDTVNSAAGGEGGSDCTRH